MDQSTKNFITDILGLLVILFFTILGYSNYGSSGILLLGGLALAAWVAGIMLFRKS